MSPQSDSLVVKKGLPEMLKGGVIMDVVNAEQVRALLIYTFVVHTARL